MRSVIFLDFDGVVVCLPVERDKTSTGRTVHALNRKAVANLNRIVEATGAEVVVSSTWRLGRPIEHLRGYLRRAGFKGKVIDVTPDRWGWGAEEWERGDEILAWLKLHPDVTSYVVLDDDADMGPLPPIKWVLVKNGWFDGGLQPEHARLAIAVLRGQAVDTTAQPA